MYFLASRTTLTGRAEGKENDQESPFRPRLLVSPRLKGEKLTSRGEHGTPLKR